MNRDLCVKLRFLNFILEFDYFDEFIWIFFKIEILSKRLNTFILDFLNKNSWLIYNTPENHWWRPSSFTFYVFILRQHQDSGLTNIALYFQMVSQKRSLAMWTTLKQHANQLHLFNNQ